MKLNIAIVGLGRIGSELIEELIKLEKDGITVVAVAEKQETLGKSLALEHNIPIKTVNEIGRMGPELDIIFDVTGHKDTRNILRDALVASGNKHTTIASETIVYLLAMVIEDMGHHDLLHERKGH